MIKQHQQKLTKICQDLPGNTGPEDTKWFLQHAYTAAWACEGGSALASPRKKHHAKNPCLAAQPCQTFRTIQKDTPSGTGGYGGHPSQSPLQAMPLLSRPLTSSTGSP